MPVVKIQDVNTVRKIKAVVVPYVSNPLVLGDDSYATMAGTMISSLNVLENDNIPGGLAFDIVAVNGNPDNVGDWVAGPEGGYFRFSSDGSFSFDPSEDFNYLVDDETATTSITYTLQVEQWKATATVTVEVSAYVTPVDEMWEDVEFLYQLPQAVYTISDRTGNHSTTKIGTIGWVWNSTFPNVIAWNTATKSYLCVGTNDAFRGFCNGSFPWTFDAWIQPYNFDGMYLFSVSENSTSKNWLYARVMENKIVFTLFATKIVFTLNIPITFYEWQHIAVTLDIANNRALAFLNGNLVAYGEYALNLPFVDQPVSYAYIGIDNPSYNWFYRGMIAAARLTKGARWTSNFTPPQPPYPEVAS